MRFLFFEVEKQDNKTHCQYIKVIQDILDEFPFSMAVYVTNSRDLEPLKGQFIEIIHLPNQMEHAIDSVTCQTLQGVILRQISHSFKPTVTLFLGMESFEIFLPLL